MDPIVVAAGTALVGAMATDAWQEARTAVIDAELIENRARILAARETRESEEETEQAIAAGWQVRLQALLSENPAIADELRQLLDTRLTPASADDKQARIGTQTMKARASGSGRVYQAGRDQHITER